MQAELDADTNLISNQAITRPEFRDRRCAYLYGGRKTSQVCSSFFFFPFGL